jgi:hypothetical protein
MIKSLILFVLLAGTGLAADAPKLLVLPVDARGCRMHAAFGFPCTEDIQVLATNLPPGSAAHFTVSWIGVQDGKIHTAEGVALAGASGSASWGTITGGDFVDAHASMQVLAPSGNVVYPE